MKFKVGDKVKIPVQAIGESEGIIVRITYNGKVCLVEVKNYRIWFSREDLKLICKPEKVIFT